MKKNIFFILFSLLMSTASAQKDRLFTSENGLSNSTFFQLAQEKNGQMWIATDLGLNLFDGYNFESYNNIPKDSTTISSCLTRSVFVDSKSRLWVGTLKGLNQYHRDSKTFTHYPLLPKNPATYKAVFSILEDRLGKIWLGTSIGLIEFDPQSGTQTLHSLSNNPKEKNAADFINTMLMDDTGGIWIGTEENGLKYYNPINKQLKVYRHIPNKANSVADNTIYTLCLEKKGNIIIGTLKGGISIFDPKNHQFTTIPFSSQPTNVFDGGVYSIKQDRKGTIWVGTERNGLKMLDLKNKRLLDANKFVDTKNTIDSKVHCFEDREGNMWFAIDYVGIFLKNLNVKPFHIIQKNTPGSAFHLSHNLVKSILSDSEGSLWVGTEGGGINLLKLKTNEQEVLKHQPRNSHSIADNSIITLFEDNNKNVWAGTYLGGLSFYNRKAKSFTNYRLDCFQNNPNANHVISICQIDKNTLHVVTSGGGFYSFNLKTQHFAKLEKLKAGNIDFKIPDYIFSILLDKENNLWIASGNGLFYLNRTKGFIREYSTNNQKLKINTVYNLFEDSEAFIWVATSQGLVKIDKVKNAVIEYTSLNGMSSNVVYGILEDNRRNLWISTLNGLSKLNKNDHSFRNFYSQDGLPTNEFRPGSCFKKNDGTFYFGTTNGLLYFHPDSIKENLHKPSIVFTNLKLFNNLVKSGKSAKGKAILKREINEADQIDFTYADNSFTIEFIAIDFTGTEKIKYAYQLDGFDKRWVIKPYNQRIASYSNLSPGNYTFRVKSTNSDGTWMANTRSIEIRIAPPYWLTWWAYCLYAILLVVIGYGTYRMLLYRLKMQNELFLERMEREKLEEVNKAKLQFFTNASHEFRTPLSLIMGPIEKLVDCEMEVHQKKAVALIHKNAHRLLRLTNQLLDFQKIEENQIHLNAQPLNIINFVTEVSSTFEELAFTKKIYFKIENHIENTEVWFDPDHLDKVFFNLLSNAFKFTPENGIITILIQQGTDVPLGDYMELTVMDTGHGIIPEHLPKLFNRFYQAPGSSNNHLQAGSGIGLHLVKSLVELHKGTCSVTSEIDSGSSFSFRLPLGNKHLKPHEMTLAHNIPVFMDKMGLPKPVIYPEETIKNELENTVKAEAFRILIVEDEPEIMNYLISELSDNYKVFSATNGKSGFLIALQEVPNLIISDVMMPEMDGIELCRQLKTDIQTCHIPVILLTAQSSNQNRLEGLETGADAYISKPFSIRHLHIQVSKLIELRENLKQKFSRSVFFEAKEVTAMSADEKFIQNAMDFVKTNLSDPEFNIEEMGKNLGMSRVHLYRKIKALTNQSPSEFVRTIRLKQAAYILTQNKFNKSEIAYMVGFNSPQYFANCFQEYFHMTASEYIENNKTLN